jgi:hypothetical protein
MQSDNPLRFSYRTKVTLAVWLVATIGLLIWAVIIQIRFVQLQSYTHKQQSMPSKAQVHLQLQESILPKGEIISSVKVPHSGIVSRQVFRIMLLNSVEETGRLGGRKMTNHAIALTEKNLGPLWKTVVVGNHEAETFWVQYFGADHVFKKAFDSISNNFNAARADILRLALLYVHGGMYLDHKSAYISTTRIPELAHGKDVGVCQMPGQQVFENGEYSNWFFIARSGSPLIWTVLVKICRNINFLIHKGQNTIPLFIEATNDGESQSKRLVVGTTGPIVVTTVFKRFPSRVDASWRSAVKYDYLESYDISRGHYSYQDPNNFLTHWNATGPYIPRRLFATYHDLDAIPTSVLDRMKEFHPELSIELSDDSDCIKFIFGHFPQVVGETFNKLEQGAHKADLWRYCKLYVLGGFYCDIKTDFVRSLVEFSQLAPDHPRTWYTVLGNYVPEPQNQERGLYNGIILTPPFNPILLQAITNICTMTATDYHYIVRNLYDLVQEQMVENMTPGFHHLRNGWNIYLAKEICVPDSSKRYGIRCTIIDAKDETIVRTRYDGYGMGQREWI